MIDILLVLIGALQFQYQHINWQSFLYMV